MISGYKGRVWFGPAGIIDAVRNGAQIPDGGNVMTPFLVDEYECDIDCDDLDVTNSEGVSGIDSARTDAIDAGNARPRVWKSVLESPPGGALRFQQVTYDEVVVYLLAPYSLIVGTYVAWALQPDRENGGSFYTGVMLVKRGRHSGRTRDKQPVNIEGTNDGVVTFFGP
jgi:hypothetical protein